MNDVGKRIEELRKKKGLSRPAFCDDESGLSVRQLARIEKGEFHPTLKTLEHIAEKLEIPAYILMPDYQELPERYKEIKYFLLHHPDYGDKELQEQKDAYFDEIFEDFYDNLPRDEQIMIDCLQAIDQVRAGQNSLYGQGVLENSFDSLVDIEPFHTSTLLKSRLYFLCALMDGLNSGFIKETTQEEIVLLFKKLCHQIEETELEDLYLLRDALFAALCCLELVGEFSYFKMAVDKLNYIMNRTRDFQKKPLILMVEWKYYIQCDFNEANRKYQEAKVVAQIFGNEELITSLDREWQEDIKKYIEIAKKKKIPYKMIDSLVCSGDIALVVVAKDAIEHEAGDEIVVTSKLEMCHLKHLPDIYYEAMESPICDFHLNIIKEEMPEYAKNYKELTFMDKLFGSKCPICQKLGGKKRG